MLTSDCFTCMNLFVCSYFLSIFRIFSVPWWYLLFTILSFFKYLALAVYCMLLFIRIMLFYICNYFYFTANDTYHFNIGYMLQKKYKWRPTWGPNIWLYLMKTPFVYTLSGINHMFGSDILFSLRSLSYLVPFYFLISAFNFFNFFFDYLFPIRIILLIQKYIYILFIWSF